jgi:hypothetical protein
MWRRKLAFTACLAERDGLPPRRVEFIDRKRGGRKTRELEELGLPSLSAVKDELLHLGGLGLDS